MFIMKRILFLLILALLLKLPSYSQTVYWEEDFNSSPGWELESNWDIHSGKLEFYWDPSATNFDMSAVSQEIVLASTVDELIVTQFLEPWEWSVTNEMAEISIIVDEEESILWSYSLENGIWGLTSGSELALSINEFAGETVRFKMRTFGASTYAWNWWQVFNLSITAYFENDLSAIEIEGPVVVDLNESYTWSLEVKNQGLNAQNNFTVELYSYQTGEQIGSVLSTNELLSGQSRPYNFDWTPVNVENTALYGLVILDDDDFEDNNVSKSHFVRVVPEIEFNVLVWDNDNGILTVIDPEKGDLIEPNVALERVFSAAGIQYDAVNNLPASLEGYDMVFCTMGNYCLS